MFRCLVCRVVCVSAVVHAVDLIGVCHVGAIIIVLVRVVAVVVVAVDRVVVVM